MVLAHGFGRDRHVSRDELLELCHGLTLGPVTFVDQRVR
jgi:hypothetical protein